MGVEKPKKVASQKTAQNLSSLILLDRTDFSKFSMWNFDEKIFFFTENPLENRKKFFEQLWNWALHTDRQSTFLYIILDDMICRTSKKSTVCW